MIKKFDCFLAISGNNHWSHHESKILLESFINNNTLVENISYSPAFKDLIEIPYFLKLIKEPFRTNLVDLLLTK